MNERMAVIAVIIGLILSCILVAIVPTPKPMTVQGLVLVTENGDTPVDATGTLVKVIDDKGVVKGQAVTGTSGSFRITFNGVRGEHRIVATLANQSAEIAGGIDYGETDVGIVLLQREYG